MTSRPVSRSDTKWLLEAVIYPCLVLLNACELLVVFTQFNSVPF